MTGFGESSPEMEAMDSHDDAVIEDTVHCKFCGARSVCGDGQSFAVDGKTVCLKCAENIAEEFGAFQIQTGYGLPELNDKERAAMDSLGPDFIKRLIDATDVWDALKDAEDAMCRATFGKDVDRPELNDAIDRVRKAREKRPAKTGAAP